MNAFVASLSSLFVSVLAQTVTFEPGTHAIDESRSNVDQVLAWIDTLPEDTPLTVLGYSCADDKLPNTTDEDLLDIADARAIKLRQELVLRGVDATRISTIAYGYLPAPGAENCRATATVLDN